MVFDLKGSLLYAGASDSWIVEIHPGLSRSETSHGDAGWTGMALYMSQFRRNTCPYMIDMGTVLKVLAIYVGHMGVHLGRFSDMPFSEGVPD